MLSAVVQAGAKQSSRENRKTHSIKRIHHRFLDPHRPRYNVGNGAALAQHEQDRRQRRQWSVDQRQYRGLRQVREEEHECRHAHAGADDGRQVRRQRLPEAAVRDVVEYALCSLELVSSSGGVRRRSALSSQQAGGELTRMG